MPIEIVHADITTLEVDAVVNAANPGLAGGGGVDGAIHRAAGPELARAAVRHAPLTPGEAVITPGFRLRAPWVIHTVGPIWRGGNAREEEVLRRAYRSSLELADRVPSIRTIAFPAISTGVYGFPKPLAAEIATGEMRRWEERFDRVVACLFDPESARLYRELLRPGGDGGRTAL
jgi:O-acetyl-ADP-ribose deacetylase (regulator of RNase III)